MVARFVCVSAATSRTTCRTISGLSLHHSIRPYREIRGMKRVGLNKLKHLSVNDRPLRLHQVKHKRWPVHIVGMKEANCRIVPIGDDLYPDLAFKHSIGVIQNCIDRMRGISIRADFVSSRRARPHLMC